VFGGRGDQFKNQKQKEKRKKVFLTADWIFEKFQSQERKKRKEF